MKYSLGLGSVTIASLLTLVAASPVAQQRALGGVIGSYVADDATMPLHWIYNTDSIAKKVGAGNPEFYPKPSCMFYSYKLGPSSLPPKS